MSQEHDQTPLDALAEVAGMDIDEFVAPVVAEKSEVDSELYAEDGQPLDQIETLEGEYSYSINKTAARVTFDKPFKNVLHAAIGEGSSWTHGHYGAEAAAYTSMSLRNQIVNEINKREITGGHLGRGLIEVIVWGHKNIESEHIEQAADYIESIFKELSKHFDVNALKSIRRQFEYGVYKGIEEVIFPAARGAAEKEFQAYLKLTEHIGELLLSQNTFEPILREARDKQVFKRLEEGHSHG